jgi:hypothetical protein
MVPTDLGTVLRVVVTFIVVEVLLALSLVGVSAVLLWRRGHGPRPRSTRRDPAE